MIMEWITKNNIRQLRNEDYGIYKDLKISIETDVDTLAYYMDYTKGSEETKYFDHILGFQSLDLTIRENKNHAKVMLNPPIGRHISDSFVGRVASDKGFDLPIDKQTIRRLIVLRVVTVFAFAVTGVLPGSRVAGFLKRQQPANRKFWVEHNEVYSLLYKYMTPDTFTGNYEEDIRMVFQFLWLYFPHDITGFDDTLKQLTLEGNLF